MAVPKAVLLERAVLVAVETEQIVAQLPQTGRPILVVERVVVVIPHRVTVVAAQAAQESSFLNTQQNPIIKSSNPRVHGLVLQA